MARYYPFNREDIFPSFFANRIQDFLAGARTDLRLTEATATKIAVVPDPDVGVAAISIDGRWRFNEATVERAHPGGAKGTYDVWAVALDNDIDNEPDPFSDHTEYAFDLRITNGEDPSGAGVEVFQKIGEIDWSGAAIEAVRQTFGSVTGPQLADGALSSEAPSDITWTRAPGGGLLAGLKANSVGANELADESVDTAALIDLAVVTAKVAALAITEGKLAENSVATAKIIALAVTTAKLAAAAVTEEKLANESVAEAKIKNLAVSAAKLAAESVTNAKVGALAITEAKLAAESVGTAKIVNLAVTAAKIAAEAVETAKLANLAVTAAKLAASAVEEAKIKDGAVTSRKAKLTAGIVQASEDLELGAAYADVPGTELKITPAVASLLKVTAIFEIHTENHSTYVNGGGYGILNLDGVDKAERRAFYEVDTVAGVEQFSASVSQVWLLPLTAAAHTIKMRAKRVSTSAANIESDGTAFLYELIAS